MDTRKELFIQTKKGSGIQVESPITGKKTFEQSLGNIVSSKLESWHKPDRDLVDMSGAGKCVNQFLITVHTAFAKHYPLYLTPDMFWLCITQGFAIHVNQESERLRQKFVSHEGKKKIEIRRDNFKKGDPNNDWTEVFHEFSQAIKENIGETNHSILISDYSTTGPVEKVVSEIVLMDSMKKYFSYSVMTMCGIPSFRIGGTKSDWELMRKKADQLVKLDEEKLSKWGEALDDVLENIVKSYDGVIDDKFWDSFYRYNNASGGAVVTGWINVLFLYLQPNNKINSMALSKWNSQDRFWGNKPNSFPLGISKVPFIWNYFNDIIDMEFIGGIVGASQDKDGTLRPEFGWAVMEKVENA